VSIILQSTVVGFSAEFIRRLPELEQAMVAHGLELSQFVISKDRAMPTTLPVIGPFYDYTVFAGDEIFTVTQPDDIKFLEYFYQRRIAEDATPPAPQGRRRLGLISGLFSWLTRPI
jgi:hypothetical protein